MNNFLTKKENLFLIGIFIAAFSIRLAFMLAAKQNYFFYHNPGSDVTYYAEWAKEIATESFIGKKAFSGLPLYPYALSVLYRLSLGHMELIRLFHLLLGSLNCVLLFLLSKKIFSLNTAVLASIFTGFNFMMIYYDWLMMPVTLIIFLSLVIIIALIDRDQLKSAQWSMLGVLIGLTTLGDGKFLFFAIATFIWLWIAEPFRRKQAVIMILSAFCVLGLTCLRNKIIGGDWILISSQSGLSLYAGNHPDANGTYTNPQFIRPSHQGQDEDQKIVAEAILNRTMTEGEVSAFWKSKALQFIRHHPDQFLRLVLKKFRLFFTETEYAHDMDLLFMREWKYRLEWNALFILFPLALIGMLVTFKKWKNQPFVIFLIVCQMAVTLIFFLATRHRATILPFLIAFESVAIFWLIDRFKNRDGLQIAAAISFIVLFAAVFQPVFMDNKVLTYNRYAKAGAVYDKRGDLKNAEKSYLKALELTPGDSNLLYNLGNVYMKDGRLEQAEQTYKQALSICGYNVDALFNLAFLYEQTGRESEALQIYDKISQYQPDSPDIFFRIANIYDKAGDCEKAFTFYQKVVDLSPILKKEIQKYIAHCSEKPL
ncbi:MAG: tetratricopeptide repeat protein [Candidatus Omnitrophota bacterium]